jgi:hypothetical protein
MADEARQLTADFDDVDLEARKEEERSDSQGSHCAEYGVVGELFEEEGDNDPECEAGERGREAEALQRPWDDQQAEYDNQRDNRSPIQAAALHHNERFSTDCLPSTTKAYPPYKAGRVVGKLSVLTYCKQLFEMFAY